MKISHRGDFGKFTNSGVRRTYLWSPRWASSHDLLADPRQQTWRPNHDEPTLVHPCVHGMKQYGRRGGGSHPSLVEARRSLKWIFFTGFSSSSKKLNEIWHYLLYNTHWSKTVYKSEFGTSTNNYSEILVDVQEPHLFLPYYRPTYNSFR